MVRVERVEQAQQDLGLEAGAALHANRIADPAQIFDMRRPFEAGAVADPQEVARGVVPAAGQAVLTGEGLLIGEQQRLVTGVEARALDLRDGFGGDAARRSEEHTSELQSLMRISYAVFCLKKKTNTRATQTPQ